MRTGDTVCHEPSGETWIVACVDEANGRISWTGWPEGTAELSDCRLVEACSDEEHRAWLQRWAANRNTDDHRVRYARHALLGVEGDGT